MLHVRTSVTAMTLALIMASAVLGGTSTSAAAAGTASEWWMIRHYKANGTMVFLDKTSVSGTTTRRALLQHVYRERVQDDAHYTKALVDFDCSAKRTRVVDLIFYTWGGDKIPGKATEPSWEPTKPDTVIGEILFDVCNGLDEKRHIGPFEDPMPMTNMLWRFFNKREKEGK